MTVEKAIDCQEEKEYGENIELFLTREDRPNVYELIEIARLKAKIDKSIINTDDKPSPTERFGKMVRTLRRHKKIDIEDVSQKAAITRDKILRLEFGCMPLQETIDIFPELAKGLDVDASLLAKLLAGLL